MPFNLDYAAIWDFLYNSGIIMWLCFVGVGFAIGFLVNFILITSNNSRF
jgi:hypothetical protein